MKEIDSILCPLWLSYIFRDVIRGGILAILYAVWKTVRIHTV